MKKASKIEKRGKQKSKSLQGKLFCLIANISDPIPWLWMTLGSVKKGSEAIVTAAHGQALPPYWIKADIDNIDCFPTVLSISFCR